MFTLLMVLLGIHALIHLMGFAKAFGYAEIPALTQTISRPMGLLWLLASVLLLAVTIGIFLHRADWWIWGLPALLLSQALIFSAWKDARFGSLANLVLALAVLLAGSQSAFFKQTQSVLNQLQPSAAPTQKQVTEQDLQGQPEVIQKWLRRTGAVGQPWQDSLSLSQTGRMRTSPEGAWLKFQAKQYFNALAPGFIWQAQVQMFPGVSLLGRDQWFQNHGQMLISAWGLIPVVNARGAEIDQGTLLRYLGEMLWFPSSALRPSVQWRELSANSAEATLTVGAQTVKAVMHFGPKGDFESMLALRYYARKTGATLEKWQITANPHSLKTFSGIHIPSRYTVSWLLKEGDFDWLELDIGDLAYNSARPFSGRLK